MAGEKKEEKKKKKKSCRDPGSNQGPLDLQSNALPTELSRPHIWRSTKSSSHSMGTYSVYYTLGKCKMIYLTASYFKSLDTLSLHKNKHQWSLLKSTFTKNTHNYTL